MPNILIIAKLQKFKEQPSNNRVLLLDFLSSKKNIKVINDSSNTSLRQWIKKTKKRIKWEPSVIIYYFLSRAKEWTTIDIPDFTKGFSQIKRYMIFEDHHYSDIAIPLYKQYNFTKLIKPTRHAESEKEYIKANINFSVWGFYVNPEVFYNRDQVKKYDLLLYGFINSWYPLRTKMIEVLMFLQEKTNIRIHIIKHPGYYNKELVSQLPKNEQLSTLINQSRFTLVSSSYFRLLLKKYYEVPMSGSTIIGDIPDIYRNELENKIVELPFNGDHNLIINVIRKALKDEFLEIEKNSLEWGEKLCKELTYENSYENLCNICLK